MSGTPGDKVRDPHPTDEEHYDRIPAPGGDRAPHDDIGPNPGKHNGTAQPKPDYGNSNS